MSEEHEGLMVSQRSFAYFDEDKEEFKDERYSSDSSS